MPGPGPGQFQVPDSGLCPGVSWSWGLGNPQPLSSRPCVFTRDAAAARIYKYLPTSVGMAARKKTLSSLIILAPTKGPSIKDVRLKSVSPDPLPLCPGMVPTFPTYEDRQSGLSSSPLPPKTQTSFMDGPQRSEAGGKLRILGKPSRKPRIKTTRYIEVYSKSRIAASLQNSYLQIEGIFI